MNIKGKSVLITGGASGIGLEAARQFLAGGARVIIINRLFPKVAFGLVNPKKTYRFLQS